MAETHQTACPHCRSVQRFSVETPADALTCNACAQPLFGGHLVELDGESFPHHLEVNDIPVVVDFWAEWCAPCKMIAPAFAQAAEKLAPYARFAKVDTDEEQKLAGHNGIRGFPTLVIYKKGHEVARHAGAMSARQIEAWVREHL